MTQFTQDLLNKIKKENIAPKPKWYFMLMHVLLWSSVIVTILLGSLAVAIALRHLLGAPWEFLFVAVPNRVKTFIFMLPYVWFIFIGSTVFLSSQLFKYTKTGYRFRPVYVVLGSVFLSFILGFGLYSAELDEPVHEQLKNHLPPYAQWQERQEQNFVLPEQGILAGVIRRIDSQEAFILIDFKREKWSVDIKKVEGPELFVGMPVGVLGKKTGDYEFEAIMIRPMDPGRFGQKPPFLEGENFTLPKKMKEK